MRRVSRGEDNAGVRAGDRQPVIISKAFRIITMGVPPYKKAQVLNFFLLDEETSAVLTPQFGVSEARLDGPRSEHAAD